MDNHFHLLVEPADAEGLGKCLHGATYQYAQYFNRRYGRTGRLWENRYFSCPIGIDAYLWAVARYIERNPVRAKIMHRAEDWKWSSALDHISQRADSALQLFDWLGDIKKSDYAKYLEDAGDDEHIRKATATGRPYGSPSFIETLERQLGRALIPNRRGRPPIKK
jgi:putative transposase